MMDRWEVPSQLPLCFLSDGGTQKPEGDSQAFCFLQCLNPEVAAFLSDQGDQGCSRIRPRLVRSASKTGQKQAGAGSPALLFSKLTGRPLPYKTSPFIFIFS